MMIMLTAMLPSLLLLLFLLFTIRDLEARSPLLR